MFVGEDMSISNIFVAVASFVASIGGAAAVCIGLASWLGKIWADRLMAKETEKFRQDTERELELLRSEQQKSFHIHTLQFETEFRALRALWSKLAETFAATQALRPMMEIVDQEESKEERKRRKAKRFVDSYNEVQTTLASERPFISDELERDFDSILGLMREEYIDFDYLDDGKVQRYKEAREQMKKIDQALRHLSELIRDRIGLISKLTSQPNTAPGGD